MKKVKENWIDTQCTDNDACLHKNNSQKAYQLVKCLPSVKQGRSTTIQDKSEKCLEEEKCQLKLLLRRVEGQGHT